MKEFATRRSVFLSILTLVSCSMSASAQANESTYSSLANKDCRSSKSKTADYLGRCPGVAGYTLLITEGDLRQNVTVVAPDGRKSSLELWSVISGGFSHVGPRAEWRIKRQNGKSIPVALIVRLTANEDPANPEKQNSYLAVSKITASEICVTAKIPPGPNANNDARRAADEAVTRQCLTTPK